MSAEKAKMHSVLGDFSKRFNEPSIWTGGPGPEDGSLTHN